MGLLDTIKNSIFEEDPNKPAAPAAAPVTSDPVGTTPSSAPVSTYVPAPAVDDEAVKALRNVAYARPTAFKTLLDAMEKMKDIILDEGTRAKAAFATISSDARTPAQIIQAIDIHLNDLQGEQSRFNSLAESKKNSLSTSLAAAENNTTREIETAEREWQALHDQMDAKNKRILELKDSLVKTQHERQNIDADFQRAATNFSVAYNQVRSELENKRNIFSTIFK
jgi:chromosome segregation ATPase